MDALGGILLFVVISVLVGIFKLFSLWLQSRGRKKYNYEQLADSYQYWDEFVNEEYRPTEDHPDDIKFPHNLTWAEHSKLSTEEKIQILKTRFGKEK